MWIAELELDQNLIMLCALLITTLYAKHYTLYLKTHQIWQSVVSTSTEQFG